MASLTRKLIHGRPYYLRECQRINGKPKVVWQQYLGSAEDLARRLSPSASPALPLPQGHRSGVRRLGRAQIREVAVLFLSGSDATLCVRTVLSDLDAEQLALVEALHLARFRTP